MSAAGPSQGANAPSGGREPREAGERGGHTTRRVPTYCYQCVAGPDLLNVKVQDGVATEIEPNLCAAKVHPGGGKVCVKAFGLVQKTYNPNRILHPMKRTNPRKGRNEDPGFVEISWDEAFRPDRRQAQPGARAEGLRDESGYPRVAASFGGGGTPQSYMGTFPAFLSAWGAVDMGFGSGQGVKCYHSEHLYGELWHRAFIVAPDTPLCNYLISCGANVEASGGVVGIWRHAKARVRGMKRVQVEPHLSVTGACSAAMGADQAQDRPGLPVRADPRAAARGRRANAWTCRSCASAPPRPIWSGRAATTCATAPRASRWSGTRAAPVPGRTTTPTSTKRWRAATRSTRSRSAPTATSSATACSRARPRSPG